MSDTQKPVNIQLVREGLLEEGCPPNMVRQVTVYFESHPGASVGDLGRHLDTLASEFGHTSYHAFRLAGFQRHGVDPLLVSWV